MRDINSISLETNTLIVKQNGLIKDQFGVFAKKHFKKNQKLLLVTGPIKSKPSIYTLSVGLDKHIDPRRENGAPDFGHYLNHSCNPNAVVKVIDKNIKIPYLKLIARKNIKKGDEITFDYASLEYATVVNSACRCRARNCRGIISGFRDLPKDIVRKYEKEGILPKHLLDLKKL